MTARTTEAIVKVQMAKGGIEIVAPHEDYDATSKPHAFGVAGWSIDSFGGLGEFVGAALAVLGGGLGGCCRIGVRLCGFGRLILCAQVPALGDGATDAKQ
jgi:hypothetical protein